MSLQDGEFVVRSAAGTVESNSNTFRQQTMSKRERRGGREERELKEALAHEQGRSWTMHLPISRAKRKWLPYPVWRLDDLQLSHERCAKIYTQIRYLTHSSFARYHRGSCPAVQNEPWCLTVLPEEWDSILGKKVLEDTLKWEEMVILTILRSLADSVVR